MHSSYKDKRLLKVFRNKYNIYMYVCMHVYMYVCMHVLITPGKHMQSQTELHDKNNHFVFQTTYGKTAAIKSGIFPWTIQQVLVIFHWLVSVAWQPAI